MINDNEYGQTFVTDSKNSFIRKEMVKAPSFGAGSSASNVPNDSAALSTSHSASTYGKKFKPWRRGKSIHSKRHSEGSKKSSGGGSLKQQLRGLQRLQQKKMSELSQSNGGEPPNEDIMNEQMMEVQQKIDTLQEQISLSNTSAKERENARKSHKTRFVDRQRTTRFYKQFIKHLQQLESNNGEESSSEFQKLHHELYKLALDQVYIAHFPLDVTSYVSIYQNGSQARRQVMNNRLLYKMAAQRQCVLERLHASKVSTSDATAEIGANSNTKTSNARPRQMQRVSWIHPSQYERVEHVTTWSTQLERSTFDIIIPSQDEKKTLHISDERFQKSTDTTHRLVQEHERLEREMESSNEEIACVHAASGQSHNFEDDDSADSSNDSDEDEVSPLVSSKPALFSKQHSPRDDNDSPSDSDSSTSRVDDSDQSKSVYGINIVSNDSRLKDDSKEAGTMITAASLRSLAAQKEKTMSAPITNTNEDDDFLLDTSAVDDAIQKNVFAHAKHHVPANDDSKGDKSRGWATQKQLPGQFRKKRRR